MTLVVGPCRNLDWRPEVSLEEIGVARQVETEMAEIKSKMRRAMITSSQVEQVKRNDYIFGKSDN